MSVREARCARSCQISQVVSLAKRTSPPGMSDCSGSHCFWRALGDDRVDRGKALGAAHRIDGAVDQGLLLGRRRRAGDEDDADKTASARFMVPLPRNGDANSSSLPLIRSTKGLKIARLAAVQRRTNLMRADRVGYVVGGAALIAWALRRPSVARAAAAGVGGWLLYQAYTGSKPVLKPLGIRVNRTPAEATVAETVVVKEAITIARPRDEVYAYWQRLQNLPPDV